MTCRLRLEGRTAGSLRQLLEDAGHDVDVAGGEAAATAFAQARSDGRAFLSADPQFADAAIYDASDCAGLVILCIGVDRLDEVLNYLLEVRVANLRLVRKVIAEVASSKIDTEARIADLGGDASTVNEGETRDSEGGDRSSQEVSEADPVTRDGRLTEDIERLEQLELRLKMLIDELQAPRSETDAFRAEIVDLKASYLLAQADSGLGGRPWGAPDFELGALAAQLLEALAMSPPHGQVWIVTAESAWAAQAVKAVDAAEMREERRRRSEFLRRKQEEPALLRKQEEIALHRSRGRPKGSAGAAVHSVRSDDRDPPFTFD